MVKFQSNEDKRVALFVSLASHYGIGYERALFLAMCAHEQNGKKLENRNDYIPYEPRIQIKEAFRLGIGLKDTAKMMGMTQRQVMSYGFNFSSKSAFRASRGNKTDHNLLNPEDNDE